MDVHAPPRTGGTSHRGPAFLAVAVTFTTVASVIVFARLHVRILVKHAFGWDDVFIILSLVSYYSQSLVPMVTQ